MRILLICITQKLFVGILFLGMSLSACTIYEIDIQQGNVLDEEAVDKLKLGMTRQQVQFILGSPILKDAFHPNRWDYVHTYRPGKGEMRQRTITVLFEDNKLVNINDSFKANYVQPVSALTK